jgi:hypothetical protein
MGWGACLLSNSHRPMTVRTMATLDLAAEWLESLVHIRLSIHGFHLGCFLAVFLCLSSQQPSAFIFPICAIFYITWDNALLPIVLYAPLCHSSPIITHTRTHSHTRTFHFFLVFFSGLVDWTGFVSDTIHVKH